MNVNGSPTRTIRLVHMEGEPSIEIIDQRKLPHRMERVNLHTVEDVARAIKDMYVRGAPLIGATAALGMHLATRDAVNYAKKTDQPDNAEIRFQSRFREHATLLRNARPTAINLMWAVDQQVLIAKSSPTFNERIQYTRERALEIIENDVEQCRLIGVHGLEVIKQLSAKKAKRTVNILTHCNAGWLATVDWGTATSPMYHAFESGIDIHVWVDETRPRNQGAKLTAWELGQHGNKLPRSKLRGIRIE